jgi:hypothetical protein
MTAFALRDNTLKTTRALPSGASSVTQAAGFDVGNSSRGDLLANAELLISAPALAVGQLANGSTMKYDVVMSVNSDLSSPTIIAKEVLVQTGAGGAGAAAATARFRLPTNCARYVGVKATNSAAADASAASLTSELLF